ncbi:class A beta-lactamase-related serine hydrolase [Ferruginibacter lapsinanis]|uniref:serine hydrolase n=1 Tax=Ferruginibacter lapsinanis TaxID=563172 RepID=UPI001E379460|nr:serine hydrolase [Ferruginibacter lapsinanis]UEG49254.1 class A beta-lactamase-related serine hydrolase [Ferruginibacter lapsinanis]
MLKKTVPLYVVILLLFTTIALTYFAVPFINSQTDETGSASVNVSQNSCSYNISRLDGYKFIHPLMFAEPACESNTLSNIKSEVESLISSYKTKGDITSASVYLREFHHGEWMSIAEAEKYSPGSLLKVPELITFFKMNETNPGLLERKVVFDKPLSSTKTATYLSKSIQLGNTYTIRQLLFYMVAYSDNNATLLLNKLIDVATFKKVFTDVGLPAPDWSANDYPISAKDYSLFMKLLYNASYLSIKDSEFCTELLSDSDFKNGLVAGIPSDCKIAHKFGEGGYTTAPQLSESGIIYSNSAPYILTVMTKGTDVKKLPEVISSISKMVYKKMQDPSTVKL